MKLSIVSGTYNRIASLQRMMTSVREQLHRGLPYEFVIVDGGSTDGTLDWLREQNDVRLIEHGELRGAINAFCEGAEAARGDYVLLANDDVVFFPYSVLAAVRHLDTTPTCAAVAFADNRTWLMTPQEFMGAPEYRTEGIGVTLADGTQTMLTYAQVGLFRRELGNAAGWWGAHDPIMRKSRTYGGDSYLSARLWEMGYTVDPVDMAKVQDMIERDALREINWTNGHGDGAAYYERFPTVHVPAERKHVRLEDRLRILHLPIYETAHPPERNLEYGMTQALQRYGDVIEIDYLHDAFDAHKLCKAWQPDLVLTQIQGIGPRLDAYTLKAIRSGAPNTVIVNWNGDAHERGLISPEMLDLLRHVDLQTTVNAQVLPTYEQYGIPAAYWQIGYKDPACELPDVPRYDILFQGNCYDQRRTELVTLLREQPYKVGVYGNCAGLADGNTHYDFAAQAALYATATITVGDTFPGTKAFVSNRLFQALSQGAFLLQQHSKALEEYTGLKPGVHYIEWEDLSDLQRKLKYWMKPTRAQQRQEIAAAGRAYVREHFSYDAQVRKLFTDLLPWLEREHASI